MPKRVGYKQRAILTNVNAARKRESLFVLTQETRLRVAGQFVCHNCSRAIMLMGYKHFATANRDT
jgi:hypothetical protein